MTNSLLAQLPYVVDPRNNPYFGTAGQFGESPVSLGNGNGDWMNWMAVPGMQQFGIAPGSDVSGAGNTGHAQQLIDYLSQNNLQLMEEPGQGSVTRWVQDSNGQVVGEKQGVDYGDDAFTVAALAAAGVVGGAAAGLGGTAGSGGAAAASGGGGYGTLGTIAAGSGEVAPLALTGGYSMPALGNVAGVGGAVGGTGTLAAGGAASALGGGGAAAGGNMALIESALGTTGYGASSAGAGGAAAGGMGGWGNIGKGIGDIFTGNASAGTYANLLQTGIGLYGQNKAADAMSDATGQSNALLREMWQQSRADNQPLLDIRNQVLPQISGLLANPASLAGTPGYQFEFDQGKAAMDNSAAASGNYYSGQQMKAAQQYGQNFAGTKTDQALNRLLGVAQMGQIGSTGNQNAASQFGGAISNNTLNQGANRGSSYVGMANTAGSGVGRIYNDNQLAALLRQFGGG